MLSWGRWGLLVQVILTVTLLPCRAFGVDKLLIVNGTNLTMKAGQTAPFVGDVLVGSDGKIKAIGEGDPPAGTRAQTTYDAKGKFVLPGFISAHSYLSESAFRGLATDQYVYEYPTLKGWVEALETRELGILVVDPGLVERGPVVDPYATVVLACNAMNLAKVYVGGDLMVDRYHLQKSDMVKVSNEVNRRVERLH